MGFVISKLIRTCSLLSQISERSAPGNNEIVNNIRIEIEKHPLALNHFSHQSQMYSFRRITCSFGSCVQEKLVASRENDFLFCYSII